MMINLAKGFTSIGHPPDFVVKDSSSPYLDALPRDVNVIKLGEIHTDLEIAAALYLENAAPHAILTSKEENDEIALRAKERSGSNTRIVIRVPVNITSRLKHKGRGLIKTRMTYNKLKKVLSGADSIVAVSHGVAEDINSITGIPLEKIHVVRNPVISPELEEMAVDPPEHKWFEQKNKPVIIGIGRLGRQKNFELLIKAFAIARSKTDCRLIILGEGRRYHRLLKLIRTLKLEEHVDLPGFVVNPYSYLTRSDLFVQSSNWEGSPNALTEALALGIPVVATDCESGPREILQDGQVGRLVPVNDANALAEAIQLSFLNPVKAEILKEAVKEYTVERSSERYLSILSNS